MIRVLGLSLYGSQAASHRVRLSQFQPGLASVGIELQIQSLLGNDYLHRIFAGGRPSLGILSNSVCRRFACLASAKDFDLAILYAELIPLLPAWVEQLLLQIPYIYDFDDAFYLKYRAGRLGVLSPFLDKKIDRLLIGATAVTAGNDHLACYAKRFNSNVFVLPSVVSLNHYKPAVTAALDRSTQEFTVGWIGSPSTAPYLQILEGPLRSLCLELPVRLVVIGGPAPIIPGVDIVQLPWDEATEVELIQSFDVGVMPLPNTEWCRGKCAYKLIQYMACSIPVIASPVGTNLQAVPANCGILADSPIEWLLALRKLSSLPGLRHSMGQSGRQWVQSRYSLDTALPVLSDLIRKFTTLGF